MGAIYRISAESENTGESITINVRGLHDALPILFSDVDYDGKIFVHQMLDRLPAALAVLPSREDDEWRLERISALLNFLSKAARMEQNMGEGTLRLTED